MSDKIIFAVDPGSRKVGYAILCSQNNKFTKLDSGVINIPVTKMPDIPTRLGYIYSKLTELFNKYNPDCFVIEEVFFNIEKNIGGTIKLGQARGVAIVAAVNFGLKVYEYSARMVKKSVVGKGSADKDQVIHMVRILLNLDYLPKSDEADAIAIAICHGNMSANNIEKYLNNSKYTKYSRGRLK